MISTEQTQSKIARSFMSEWFNKADKDLNGILSIEEARTILSKFNQDLLQNTGLNKDKVFELFQTTDTNGDDMISLDEFKNAVLKNIQKITALKKKNF